MHWYMRYTQPQYEYPVALELLLMLEVLRCGDNVAYGQESGLHDTENLLITAGI